jgi:predicted DNA-binding WGR domain protein
MADSDKVKGLIDEVTLNWTDLTGAKTGATTKGSNKFYKAQIIEDGGGFKIVFNYGRVGQSGQTKAETASTLDAAKRTFDKKVKAKMAKGYHKIEMRSEADEVQKAKDHGVTVEKKTKKKKKKKGTGKSFHKEVEALLRLMYDATGTAIKKGLSSGAGASDAAPLGNLSDHQLDDGADLLDKIEALVKKKGDHRDELIDLTNDYLSNIPRNIDEAVKHGKLDIDAILLNDDARIQAQRQFIGLLRDAHLQKEVFAEAAVADDPVEVWYDGLNCDLSFVEQGTPEFKEIAGYFDNGQSPKNSNFYNKLEVRRVWKLERIGKKDNFDDYAKKIAKKKGATGIVRGWHGTRTENLMGISKSGLLMPEHLPKGVHVTGKAFGKGIYAAPCWPDAGKNRKGDDGKTYKRFNGALKSMNYTSLRGAYWSDNVSDAKGFMFLQEIALGVPEVHLKACWDKARPAKGKDYIYAKAFGNPQLSHDEIVTFDEEASRMTHLMEIGYKKGK